MRISDWSSDVCSSDLKLKATEEALAPLLAETGSADRVALGAAIERSRAKRGLADEIAATERAILEAGDGLRLDELLAAVGAADPDQVAAQLERSEEHTSELQSLMRISSAVFCLKKNK